MHNRNEKTRKHTWEWMFDVITAMLVVVGILAQYGCENLAGTPFLKRYLLHLFPAFGIFLGYYLAGIGIHSRKWYLRLIPWLLIILMLLSIFFVGVGIALVLEEEREVDRYERQRVPIAIRHLLDRAKLFGSGEFCYEYPDSVLEGYEAAVVGLPEDVFRAFQEREMAEYYFEDYRSHTMLPVLSYSYGLWVNWLYVALTAVWCVLGAAVWLRLYRWWERALYLIPYGAVACQMVNGVLYGFGKNVIWSLYPFSGNLASNLLFVAPALGLLFGLVKASRPKLPMLLEPDDDFWHEIIDDEPTEVN